MKQGAKRWRTINALAGVAGVALGLTLSSVSPVAAAGSASFGIGPANGTYTVGDTINVAVSMTSSPSNNSNAAQVNLTFPTSLAWRSTTLTGPFTLCAQNSHTATTVRLACAAPTVQSGTQSIVTVSFTVMSAGTATVAMAAGSDIAATNGSSVFNGSLPSATYSLTNTAATSPAPSPSASPGTSAKAAAPGASTPADPASITPSPTPVATENPSTGSLSITVQDAAGKRVSGALVKLDGHVVKTNANGVANFSGISSGKHMLYITAAGKQPVSATVTIGSGENKLVTYTLTGQSSSKRMWLIVTGGILVLIIGGVTLYLKFRSRQMGKT